MILTIPILSISTLGHFRVSGATILERKRKVLPRGKNNYLKHFNAYFREHPEVYKDFLIW
jgi:hypothetical protein